jgi:hypothetical protein
MEQVGFQGYAQSKGFDPVKISNANVQAIAAEGERVIRGMERLRDQDIKNRTAFAEALSTSNRESQRSRDAEYDRRSKNRERMQTAKLSNLKTVRINAEREEQNIKNTYESLAGLSKTAASQASKIAQDRIDRNWEQGVYDAYVDGVPLDKQVEQETTKWNVTIAGEALERGADVLEAQGVSAKAVNDIRSNNPVYRMAYRQAQLKMMGDRWSTWVEDQLYNEQADRTFQRPDGTEVRFGEVFTNEDRAAAVRLLMPEYLKSGGYGDVKTEYLGQFLRSVRSSEEKRMAETTELEIKNRLDDSVEKAKEVAVAQGDPMSARLLYTALWRQAKGNHATARKNLEEFLSDVNNIPDETTLRQMLDFPLPGDEERTFAQRFPASVRAIEEKRRQANIDSFKLSQQELEVENQKMTEELRKSVIENGMNYTSEQLDEMYENFAKNNNKSGMTYIDQLRSYTPEKELEEATIKRLQEKQMLGDLREKDILDAPLSYDAKVEWLRKVNSGVSMDETTAKDMEKLVNDELKLLIGAAAYDTASNGSLVHARRWATSEFRKHFVKRMEENGGNSSEAFGYASGILNKYLEQARNKNGSVGPLRIANYTMAKDGRTGAYFVQHTLPPGNPTPSTIKPIIDRVRQLKTVDQLSNELVIPKALLEQVDRQRRSTGRITMPSLAQKIADQYGGRVESVEVLNRQLQLAGLDQVPVDMFKKQLASIDPIYQRMISYRVAPARTDIALIGSGQPAVYRQGSEMQSAGAMLLQQGLSKDEAVLMTAVMMAESGGDPQVVNNNRNTGDLSYGLFQINMIDDLGPARMQQYGLKSYDDLKDPNVNVRVAAQMFKAGGPTAWGAYKNGSYKKFMDQARQAVNQAAAGSFGNSPWRQGQNMNSGIIPQLMGRPAKERTVMVGRQLLQMGYKSWQHPNFNLDSGFVPGGRQRVMQRSYDSAHHHGEALDFPLSHNNEQQLDNLYRYLSGNQKQLGIRKILWRDGGMHEDHLHVEFDHQV